MSYNGYLLKVGEYEFPNRGIVFGTYENTYATLDIDSYRDGNGDLHRDALKNRKPVVSFMLKSGFTNQRFDVIMNNIRDNYIIPEERKCSVTSFVPELGDYVTQDMYLVDPKITIKRQENNTTLIYDAIQFEFVAY